MDQKQIVFLLSTSYAGSRFLGMMLGSHSKAKDVGELQKICQPQQDDGPSKMDSFFEGIPTGENVQEVHPFIFSRLDAKQTILVDGSKRITWASQFLKSPLDRKYIHLIRDPRAFVLRYRSRITPKAILRLRLTLCQHRPAWMFKVLGASADMLLFYRWLRENQDITHFLMHHHLKWTLVTYRDLVLKTEPEMKRLTEWCGLPFEKSQLEYWNFEHPGSKTLPREERENELDLRWQKDLPPALSQSISDNPLFTRYLRKTGLYLVADGLTTEVPYSEATKGRALI